MLASEKALQVFFLIKKRERIGWIKGLGNYLFILNLASE